MLAFLVLVEMCELVAETARSDVDAAKVLGKVHRVLELFVDAWVVRVVDSKASLAATFRRGFTEQWQIV